MLAPALLRLELDEAEALTSSSNLYNRIIWMLDFWQFDLLNRYGERAVIMDRLHSLCLRFRHSEIRCSRTELCVATECKRQTALLAARIKSMSNWGVDIRVKGIHEAERDGGVPAFGSG